MKKTSQAPVSIHSISELHKLMGLRGPAHPMISLVDNTRVEINMDTMPDSFVLDFYKISYKKTMNGRIGYGQGYYDFDEGGLIFTAPHQVIYFDSDVEYYGFSILFHPDFLRNYPLGKNMNKYGFFSYDTREALHLSEKEKTIMLNIMEQIGAELETNIDDFSQDVIISYLEVLLNYSNRFYKRQFITRKAANHDLLARLEELLAAYFEQRQGLQAGLPTVEYLAGQLNLSPRYLSDMLRSLTGQSAQQHIHQKLIDKAKEYLTTTGLSVSEIAYLLGFERPQSFNKLFRKKTDLSPLEFKQSFN
ncbi:helix-turn-helix transcriptional regulator [Mucilaginibacter sp. SMC90]|uniref:helix-turn-helix domain-containing protein n=1 Tax=Mucilaginibacter sp. SMC90 TaxID=2929803 RepID=UPI001FB25347|nr:helix-turn-helix transcriptional regulator [Mucilaginibacter sp. SMC90]UOE46628.1 helix-turn-helix transcriptional regulator [Mucilaginibacter sp. SMC90]